MINDLSELRKLLRLCRAQGVLEIEIGNVKLKLGDLPTEPQPVAVDEGADPYASFPDGDLSPDQLAFYSAGGLPEDDPVRTN